MTHQADDPRTEFWRVETRDGVETIRVWPFRSHRYGPDVWSASHPRYGTVGGWARSARDAAEVLAHRAQWPLGVLAPGAPTRAEIIAKMHAVEAERDAALAHAEELTKALRETQRERDALRRAARAMSGADQKTLRGLPPAALHGLAPEAMRAVLTKRGWHLDSKAMWYADRSVVAAEVWEHPTARATKPGQPWLKRVEVLVLPDAADKATRVAEWAEAVASRHGDVSAVEVLAEALLEAAQGGV